MTAQQYLDQLNSQEQLAFCASLPKIELHAHLNGSIRGATIRWRSFRNLLSKLSTEFVTNCKISMLI